MDSDDTAAEKDNDAAINTTNGDSLGVETLHRVKDLLRMPFI
jgi:hypothetical protein